MGIIFCKSVLVLLISLLIKRHFAVLATAARGRRLRNRQNIILYKYKLKIKYFISQTRIS